MRELDSHRIRAPASESGFTIVEVAVALSVLLTGLLATIGLFDDSRDQNATGERTEIGVMQAEQAIEEMRGLPYANLMLSAGAVDPTAGQRVLSSGAQLKVKPDVTEPLVYYSTEGKAQADAWVEPVTEVSIGSEEAPLDLTIHRFVSWRDEECRLADLDSLGLGLPGAIDAAQTPLGNLVNSVLQSLLGLLSGSQRNLINTLRNRLDGLENALLARESQLSSAVGGITELDLCDINLTLLGELQKLGKLNMGLSAAGGLTADLASLQSALSGICLPIVGCVLGQAQNTAINGVHSQLNCMFGATTDTQAEFDSYLSGLVTGLDNVGDDVSNTVKNSKRVTVAVVVEPRNGVGPSKPIWMSSVVRDPGAGLLAAQGAPCQ
jgi:type II secretory pathway pseudopilin PulG